MNLPIETLLADLRNNSIPFTQVIEYIDTYCQHNPTAFKNGDTYNEANQNQGSAKVFSFAKLNNLNEEDTLLLFAEHYSSVLSNPNGSDHQNIRQFITHGWTGVVFEGEALVAKLQ